LIAQPPGKPLRLHHRPFPEDARITLHKRFPGFRLDKPGAGRQKYQEEHPHEQAQPGEVPPSPEKADFRTDAVLGWLPCFLLNPVWCCLEAPVESSHRAAPYICTALSD